MPSAFATQITGRDSNVFFISEPTVIAEICTHENKIVFYFY